MDIPIEAPQPPLPWSYAWGPNTPETYALERLGVLIGRRTGWSPLYRYQLGQQIWRISTSASPEFRHGLEFVFYELGDREAYAGWCQARLDHHLKSCQFTW
ncbi:hypothetical protein SAMN05444413_101502 [Roseivivax marinus]|uniref:hypothetical protein n=1 Tax=Roseivivax marinus TaxID=1379903 RepID=UPI0008BAD251|nr:hypothetical protein [Roseivivax marinus]SEK40000.1 hypothetical protein SAMN05444413_101502 [Roseivivax marinus]